MSMTTSVLQILNRKKYDIKIKGSDRIYFSAYPYKAKLINNNIWYDVNRTHELLDFIDSMGEGDIKFRNSITRNVYFKNKQKLDLFTDMFMDQIDFISGPVSKDHIDFLFQKITNTDVHYDYEIRKKNFYNNWDSRCWVLPNWRSMMGVNRWSQAQQLKKEVLEKIVSMLGENCKLSRSNLYFNKEDLSDLQFFLKLTYPDVTLFVTHALVEESL